MRGYRWNVKGMKFFELHLKFEELYDDVLIKIDKVAERILTLGGIPEHRYSTYIQVLDLVESGNVSDGIQSGGDVLNAIKVLLIRQRQILFFGRRCRRRSDLGSHERLYKGTGEICLDVFCFSK